MSAVPNLDSRAGMVLGGGKEASYGGIKTRVATVTRSDQLTETFHMIYVIKSSFSQAL
jgi:hypothetical protein